MTNYPSKLKKIIIVFIVALGMFLLTTGKSYAITQETKDTLDKSLQGITRYRDRMSDERRVQAYDSFLKLVNEKIAISGGYAKEILTYIRDYVQGVKDGTITPTITTTTTTTKTLTDNTEYIPKVDFQKVQEAWLSWHNQERENLGLDEYTVSRELNATAREWAQHLADLNYSTHKRKSTDGYYNYESIKEWFNNHGILFPKEESGVANFSENIAYQYYKCNKEDCTQDLITALKKGYDFFMSEKSYNGAHYRAIASKYFTTIGFGVGFVGTRYYVVTHYVTEIVE